MDAFNFKTFNLKPFKTAFKPNLIGKGEIDFNDFKDNSGEARFKTIELLLFGLPKKYLTILQKKLYIN
ncbi:hypothetical protein OEG92_05475 [Polaribacter sejongensis]|uniref:hypothetical protein n=1 Tax=Polaribacter sejongensis TaxID=985043 RepID=UPI0035A5D2AF